MSFIKKAVFLLILVLNIALPVQAVDLLRGRNMYEARCSLCHSTSVHNRASRKAKTFDDIRAQVKRWSAEVGGEWSEQDLNDIAAYLNNKYYQYPCPPNFCGTNTTQDKNGQQIAGK